MSESYQLYKSLYFYIVELLKKKNVSEEFIIKEFDSLLKFANITSIEGYDYSSLRVASSRMVVLSFIDLEDKKATSVLSLLGLATEDEEALKNELSKVLNNNKEFLDNLKNQFIEEAQKFERFIHDQDLIASPILDKNFLSVVLKYAGIKEKTDFLELLLEKRSNLKISVKNKEDINLMVITDFYSPIITAPFAFPILNEYNSLLKPVADEIIKYKHVYSIFEIVMTYKITKWILTEKWED